MGTMPPQLTRRNFLALLAAAPALPYLIGCTKQPAAFPELFPGRLLSAAPGGKLYLSERGASSTRSISLPLPKAHSVNFLPSPDQVLVLEFGGEKGSVVSVKSGGLLSEISPGKGCYFGGHARMLKNKERIFFTEIDASDPKKGWLVERDAALKEIRRAPTSGNFAHGLMLLEDRATLVVQHIGESTGEESYSAHAQFSAHDLGSLRFREKLKFDSNPALLAAGDLLPAEGKDAFLKSAAYLMELRKFLNPSAPVMIVEDALGKRVSLWQLPEKKLLRLHSTAPYTPVHSVITSDFSAFLIGTKEGALFRLGLRDGSWSKLAVEIPCEAHLTFLG